MLYETEIYEQMIIMEDDESDFEDENLNKF